VRRLGEPAPKQLRGAFPAGRSACLALGLTALSVEKDTAGPFEERPFVAPREQSQLAAVWQESLGDRERPQGSLDALEPKVLSPRAPRRALPRRQCPPLRQELPLQVWMRSAGERPPGLLQWPETLPGAQGQRRDVLHREAQPLVRLSCQRVRGSPHARRRRERQALRPTEAVQMQLSVPRA